MGCGQSKTPVVWDDSRVVTTKYGQLQGKRLVDETLKGPVDAYLGIPFAAPPVGPLRFKKPEPPITWTGVRVAKTWGPVAIQGDFILKNKHRPKHSEDCLQLNLFAPTWNPEFPSGFPVMVFIHGGAFAVGNAFDYGDENICRTLVSKDVIVVTIQYRLGFLGFWYTGDECIPANLGLWDQVAALQWIQDNVDAFGGDKNNVTVCGESAGGASADLLTLSPHSNRLFHKAIPMSNSAECDVCTGNSFMPLHCEIQAKRMKITWKNPEEMYDKLMAAPAEAFAFSLSASRTGKPNEVKRLLHTGPVVEGDFFPESYEDLRKKATPKPFLTGVCKNEALLFDIFSFRVNERRSIQAALEESIPDGAEDAVDKREKLHSEYNLKSGTKRQKLISRLKLISDANFNSAAWKLLQDQVAANGDAAPVFAYVYCYNNPKSWGFLRFLAPFTEATHGTELAFLFGKSLLTPFKFNENDKRIIELLSTAFTNFVKYRHGISREIEESMVSSDPNGPKESPSQLPIPWPRLTKENNERHVLLDTTMEMRDSFFDGRPARIAALRSN